MRRSWSLRSKLAAIVILGAVLPLALVGFVLTRTAAQSGEQLLQSRLDEALAATVTSVGANWVRIRSGLLSVGDLPQVQTALAVRRSTAEIEPVTFEAAARDLAPGFARITLLDASGAAIATVPAREDPVELPAPRLSVRVPIYALDTGERLGFIDAVLNLRTLLESPNAPPLTPGMVLAAFDPESGASLLPLPFDPDALEPDRFRWAGDEWITARQDLTEPPLRLVLAAPLTPFLEPFEEMAGRGLRWLIVVSLLALLLAGLATARTTASLGRLAEAATAVAAGDLDRKVEAGATDEVGRVAVAFNRMTENLRKTLGQLAQRESLAAVGEFAASLAHEIRNPLTSIRIDLQRVEEELPEGFPMRGTHSRALQEIERLDRTVADTLRLARSGGLDLESVDLREPIRAAAHLAEAEFDSRGGRLELSLPDEAILCRGDEAALEQMFLNLLLNAAQAAGADGEAALRLSRLQGEAVVEITDNGPGIPADIADRVFEPFVSGRPEGTGLGLAIVRRIVTAHSGDIDVVCNSEGTTFRVRLPLSSTAEL